jgi:hypothetical protein
MQSILNREELVRHRSGSRTLSLAGFAVGAVLLACGMWGEDAAPAARAVRLSSLDGTVRISHGSQVLADAAVENTPLFEGTQVVTGDDGRAEIQFEDGSVARLSPNSSLTLKVLRGQGGSGDAEIVLDGGLGYFELQGGAQSGKIRVRFSDSVVTASGYTVLRINLDNPPGEFAVFSGNAHLERGDALSLDLHGGESVVLNGADASRYNLTESIEPDSWDTWNSDRDQVLTSDAAAKTGATSSFADNSNPAWGDLDANGNWYNVPDQGYVWSPYEAASTGFDPYGNGNWMFTPGYGYTWVSGYGWGYMPYQCGNWNWYEAFGWGWAPGMNGCQPWWGVGYYGGPFIGSRYGGYRPPIRPRRPRLNTGGGNHAAYPMVAVNRRLPGGATALPARDRTTVVEIAGHTVQPLRPLSPRPQYERSASGFVNRMVYPGAGTAGGAARASGPSYTGSRAGSVSSTAARSSGGSTHTSTSSPASGGGSAGHASSGGGGSSGGAHH